VGGCVDCGLEAGLVSGNSYRKVSWRGLEGFDQDVGTNQVLLLHEDAAPDNSNAERHLDKLKLIEEEEVSKGLAVIQRVVYIALTATG
jgi:hypothetical protein